MGIPYDPSSPENEMAHLALPGSYYWSLWYSTRTAGMLSSSQVTYLDGFAGLAPNVAMTTSQLWTSVHTYSGDITGQLGDTAASTGQYVVPAASAAIFPHAKNNDRSLYTPTTSSPNVLGTMDLTSYSNRTLPAPGLADNGANAVFQPSPNAYTVLVWRYPYEYNFFNIQSSTSASTFNLSYSTGNGPYATTRYLWRLNSQATSTMELPTWSASNGWHVAIQALTTVGAEGGSVVGMVDGHVMAVTNLNAAIGRAAPSNGGYPFIAQEHMAFGGEFHVAEILMGSGTLTRVQMHRIAMRLAFSYGTAHPAVAQATGLPQIGPNILCLGNSTTGTGYPGSIDLECADIYAIGSNYGIFSGTEGDISTQFDSVLSEATFWRDYGRPVVIMYHSGHNDNFVTNRCETWITSPLFTSQKLRAEGHRLVVWAPSTWNGDTGREASRQALMAWMSGAPVSATGGSTFLADRSAAYTPNYANIDNYVDGFIDIGNTHQWGIWDYNSGAPPAGTSRGDFASYWSDYVHPTADLGDQNQAQLVAPCVRQASATAAASAITDTTCTLAITGSTAGVTFEWYQASGGSKNGILLAGTGSTITVTGLASNTTYTFRCRATGAIPQQSGNPRYWWLETLPVAVTTLVTTSNAAPPATGLSLQLGATAGYTGQVIDYFLNLTGGTSLSSAVSYSVAGLPGGTQAGTIANGTVQVSGTFTVGAAGTISPVLTVTSGGLTPASPGNFTASALPSGGGASTDPGVAHVQAGTAYEINGASLTGTYDPVTGNYSNPGAANVVVGNTYKYAGATITGTYVGTGSGGGSVTLDQIIEAIATTPVIVATNNDKAGYSLAVAGFDLVPGFGGKTARQTIQSTAAFLYGVRSGVPVAGAAGTITFAGFGTVTVDTIGNITLSNMAPPA